jgi:hypothetical protein
MVLFGRRKKALLRRCGGKVGLSMILKKSAPELGLMRDR